MKRSIKKASHLSPCGPFTVLRRPNLRKTENGPVALHHEEEHPVFVPIEKRKPYCRSDRSKDVPLCLADLTVDEAADFRSTAVLSVS